MNDASTLTVSREPLGPEAAAEGRRSPAPVFLCLAVAVACSATLLLIFQSTFTFRGDDWEFLIERRGTSAGVFLDPHVDHIVILPVTIYKSLLATFGMSSSMPFSVVSTLVFLLSVVLLFVYLRRRVGDWPALLGSILILFLGAAWIDLLWSFQIGYSGAIAAGLAALLALERDDRKGDWIACGLLVVATGFSEIGVFFALGALANIAIGPRPRRQRLYVAVVPLVLYAIWFLGWGHKAESTFTVHSVVHSPVYVFDAVSQAIASLLGLATPLTGDRLEPVGLLWGHILFVILAALALWRIRQRGLSRGLLTALVVGGAFWFLGAFNYLPGLRTPTTGRYQYPGGVFVLMIAAELLRGVRVDRRVLAGAAAVTAAAVVSGIFFLHDGYRSSRTASELKRARLAALDIARPSVNPDLEVRIELITLFTTGAYYSAVDAFGSPGFTESELAASSEEDRAAADGMFRSILGITLTPSASGASSPRGPCGMVPTGTGAGPVPLGPGAYRLMDEGSGPGASVYLSRFASEPFVSLGALPAGQWQSLRIPTDRSDRPWRLTVGGPDPVRVCSERSRTLGA